MPMIPCIFFICSLAHACAKRPGLPLACHSGYLTCLALLGRGAHVAFAPRERLRQSFFAHAFGPCHMEKTFGISSMNFGERCVCGRLLSPTPHPACAALQICATITTTTVSASAYGSTPVLLCLVYTIIGMIAAKYLLSPIVPLTYERNRLEGGFRLTHSRVREYCECIAMYDGEQVEKAVSGRAFRSLYATYRDLILKQLPARGVNQALSMIGTVAAYACVAVPVMLTSKLGARPLDESELFNVVGTCSLRDV